MQYVVAAPSPGIARCATAELSAGGSTLSQECRMCTCPGPSRQGDKPIALPQSAGSVEEKMRMQLSVTKFNFVEQLSCAIVLGDTCRSGRVPGTS
ncbi:Protein of unknown function [Gryllus bimaculatus]|nr:Protein of unknown function [Gryllus bimaculatus]